VKLEFFVIYSTSTTTNRILFALKKRLLEDECNGTKLILLVTLVRELWLFEILENSRKTGKNFHEKNFRHPDGVLKNFAPTSV
jgi:hypothetical protein